MTDTPQGDHLRERLAAAAWRPHIGGRVGWEDASELSRAAFRRMADALLPVVTAHTDAKVQAALAEQREQIVGALDRLVADGLPERAPVDVRAFNDGLRAAARHAREVSQP